LLRPVLDDDEPDADDDSDVRDDEGVRPRTVDDVDEADDVESLFSSRSVKL
jgi:hypothetical protein